MIRVIDLGIGNLRSVLDAFGRVGADVEVATRADQLEGARAVVLPGVGSFRDGLASLYEKGLVERLLQHAVNDRKPLLGICLGMQLLAEEGEEHGLRTGLGLIRGRVVRLRPSNAVTRVPNMGWCDVNLADKRPRLFDRSLDGEPFYFAHSYYLECTDASDVAATIEYGGQPITAAIERENILGVQFHPEKSQDAGLGVLASFVEHVVDGVKAGTKP